MRGIILSLVVLFLLFIQSQIAGAAESRPNILFIVADDLGWSDVGWHGGFGKTPNLDQLVRTGVELDRHYVQPVCTPTRTALMSGRYPGRFGPHALVASNLRAMPLGTVTLASALKSLGYETCQSGKWHLGSRAEWGPNKFGFDHSYGTLTGAADPWTHKYRPGPYEDTWHRDGVRLDEQGNATELVAAEVVRRIEQMRRPWFAYVAFHAVHTPVDAPDKFKRMYDGVKFDDDPARQDSRLRMAAEVSQSDTKVGEFVAALERTGQRENTLIVFTSDNGGIESLRNAYVGSVPDSPLNSENDPLRGQKNTLYEGGIRVCAFANWPGKLSARKHSGPMHVADWFPTIAALVGFKPKVDLEWDGVNQWPTLVSASADEKERSIYIAMKAGRALIEGDWKLIVRGKTKPQLFNLADDPYENNDLAGNMPKALAEMQARLRQQREKDSLKRPADLLDLPE
jgi:arylsulfatase A-like enzyme